MSRGGVILQKLASLKFTVIVLALIALLVIAGTIGQAQWGIYTAQQMIFASWVFWIFGVLPVPGMLLAGVLFLVNLSAALACRFSWRRPPLGLLLIHVGLLLLTGGGFFIAATAQESFLTLAEGESGDYSMASGEWEVAMEARPGAAARVWAVDVADLDAGRELAVADSGVAITLKTRAANSRMVAAGAGATPQLEPLPSAADPGENIPGLRLEVRAGRETASAILFGGEKVPLILNLGGAEYAFSLRQKRFPLPLRLTLLDFKKTLHAGSDVPKSFDSVVEIEAGGGRRQAVISMNRPLRFREYTFYQSSYGEVSGQGEYSTFSVVRSVGRWLPYAASALLFFGLAVHFLGRLLARSRKAEADVLP